MITLVLKCHWKKKEEGDIVEPKESHYATAVFSGGNKTQNRTLLIVQ